MLMHLDNDIRCNRVQPFKKDKKEKKRKCKVCGFFLWEKLCISIPRM